MITVQLLGGACLRSGDVPLSGPPAQRHRIALLALVVASWPQPLSRDRAMALLWPEKDTASARRLLNLAVHVLRAALGERAIVSTGDGLLLDPAHLCCDLHELRAAIAAGDAERIVRISTGSLLDGFHLDESTEFGYWLDERRRELQHACADALRTVAERQERAGDVHGRVGSCRRLVALDPHSAAHALALMRALDAAGDRAGAIQHAAAHARRVRADLDLEPDANVVAYAAWLRAAPAREVQVHEGAGAPTRPPRRSAVAVLPFQSLGADPDDDCFADGITEDVIAHLSKLRGLRVISRTSVLPFKQRRHTLREIGATLGVPVLLDGSIRRAGDRVRIVATLVDAEADRHLWAETYDRRLTDIFAIQTDVALQIAAALQTELSRDERARVERTPTRDLLAYQLFLQGRQWQIRFTPDGLRRAAERLERALVRDPSFALAAAQLAVVYADCSDQGAMAPAVVRERATAAAATALRLDPELAEAHCAVGLLKMTWELDWAGAEEAFRRALELSPGSADTCDYFGRLCLGLGRLDEAVALMRRAQELDPLAHRSDLATTLLRAGRRAEAIAFLEEVLEVEPDYDRARATLGWAYFLEGRRAEGIAQLQRAVTLSPDSTVWLAQLGEAFGLAGRTDEARAILRELEERARAQFVSPYHLAYVYTGLGDAERAIDALEHAAEARTGAAYAIRASFLFTPLHEHPRFQALLRRMRLA